MESEDILKKQERLYWKSRLVNRRWYRKVYGGTWRYLKLGKDTPYIRIFGVWTKMGLECWGGYKEVLTIENHPITNVDSHSKFYRQLFKNILNLN
jgi:hypothetical protein